jgi:hypothetical protein
LPTYRPQILLAGRVQLTLFGETSVTLQPTMEDETPSLAMDCGRASVVSVDDRGARLRLDLAGRIGTTVLADAGSALAAVVLPYLPEGANPLAHAPLTILGLHTTSGEVLWSEGDGEPVTIAAGQVLVIAGNSAPQLMDAGPLHKWVAGRDLSGIDNRASDSLETYLTSDRPLSLSLLEKTEFRQTEVEALSCRCLASLDTFEPILSALNDEKHHSYWHSHYDALRVALARHRESAAAVLAALEKDQADGAERIFRLLWGYSPEQLETGEAKNLVSFLEHETMIARVLALENLRRITGKTLLFRPEEPPGEETRKVNNWRRDLDAGLIRYNSPPVVVPGLPAGASEKPPLAP